MKALILAGGFATRLRPLSCSRPKLLFPIVGVPLMDYIIKWLTDGRLEDVILAVNHFSDRLRNEIASRNLGSRVALSVEEKPLGTGGPVRLAHSMLGSSEPVVVVNGDIVSNIDLQGLVATHFKTGADATVALVSVPDPRQFGLATVDSTNEILGFEEKSQKTTGPGWVNAGVYVLNPRAVDMIPNGRAVSLEREIFPMLVRQRKMRAWKHTGFWYDIGRIPDYIVANRELLLKQHDLQSITRTRPASRVEGVKEPSYLGDDCTVAGDAKLGPYTIFSPRVSVKKGSVIRNTIVFEETTIGENCAIDDSLIGEGVRIGDRVKIGEGSMIAGQIAIPEGTTIGTKSIVLN